MKATPKMTPTEFLSWTMKVKNELPRWLEITKIQEIRSVKPELPDIPAAGAKAEIAAVEQEREKLLREQGLKNFWRIVDAAAEKHAAETVRLIAVLCDVAPEDADKHTMGEYLEVLNDTLSDVETIRFFSLFLRLEKSLGLIVQKQLA